MWAAIGLKERRNSESEFSVNNAAHGAGVSKTRIWQANVVLEYAPKLVDLVIADEIGPWLADGAGAGLVAITHRSSGDFCYSSYQDKSGELESVRITCAGFQITLRSLLHARVVAG